jgi:hypothetical protein
MVKSIAERSGMVMPSFLRHVSFAFVAGRLFVFSKQDLDLARAKHRVAR